MTKKILITGGAGFIGSHLAESFAKDNIPVVILDNLSNGRIQNIEVFKNKVTFIQGDIRNPEDLAKAFEGVTHVAHLAALADIVPSITNPADYYSVNVTGTFNVLEAAKKNKIQRLVYAASSSCYGIPEKYPTSETQAIRPEYPYALTKYLGEELVLHWNKVYQLPALSLRFFNVYGPRSRTSGTYGAVFGVFLKQKLEGKPYTVVGDGQQTRDFTFVTDVVAAVRHALDAEITGEVFNVGSGKTVSVNRLVELLGGDKTYIPKRPGEPDATFADISKIKSLLGWQPQVNIEEGIKKMLENIDYWRDAPLWDEKSIARETKAWFHHLGKSNRQTEP